MYHSEKIQFNSNLFIFLAIILFPLFVNIKKESKINISKDTKWLNIWNFIKNLDKEIEYVQHKHKYIHEEYA